MAQLRSKRKAPSATMPGEASKCIYPESGKRQVPRPIHAGTRGELIHQSRGLPLGYLNQLEQRLAETESALYGALMTIRSMGQVTAAQVTAKTETSLKHKAARMEEWSQLPLREWPDMERWLTVMSDRFIIERPSDVVSDTPGRGYTIPRTHPHGRSQTLADSHSGQPSYAWQPRDNTVSSGRLYDAHHPHPGVTASPVYFGHQVAVEPEPGPSPGSSPDGITNVEDAGGVSVDVDADADADADARAGVETGLSKAEELSHNNPSLYF
ncbi:hypothetical protein N7530_011515 [Penicillium desertorum]|uniref:Uncharacterized protein n=1 Tax=Penicillium desertorum TaxID=1303715 RepID=A0A9W9WDL6_9EURO|nr:hypothetical protein N7530_011515 [Penicillium desertorum]